MGRRKGRSKPGRGPRPLFRGFSVSGVSVRSLRSVRAGRAPVIRCCFASVGPPSRQLSIARGGNGHKRQGRFRGWVNPPGRCHPISVLVRVRRAAAKDRVRASNRCPLGVGSVHGVDLRGDVLALLAPGFVADRINGRVAGDLVKPRAQQGVRLEAAGLAGQLEEDRLRDFLGQLRRADLAQGGGIDQSDAPADKFRKRILGVVPRVPAEQFLVAVVHLHRPIVADPPNRTSSFDRISRGTDLG